MSNIILFVLLVDILDKGKMVKAVHSRCMMELKVLDTL